MTTAVQFQNVSRHYGTVRAVDDVSVEIAEGEFFAMLGPSGSGKTTCLRLIAGFEQPSAGGISLFGDRMVAVPPYRRAVNTVFQDYALFPHLNVLDNVAYGLKIAGQGRVERFRALIMKPRVLLLDEPLGALDLKLREQMQDELKALQRKLGITFVFVTHDQGEALSMADRVAVFNKGKIEQIGSPEDIYHRPEKPFVADFVGSSNVLAPEVTERLVGKRHYASLRPEAIRLGPEGREASVVSTSFIGTATRAQIDMGGIALTVLVQQGSAPKPGDTVRVSWAQRDLHMMVGE